MTYRGGAVENLRFFLALRAKLLSFLVQGAKYIQGKSQPQGWKIYPHDWNSEHAPGHPLSKKKKFDEFNHRVSALA